MPSAVRTQSNAGATAARCYRNRRGSGFAVGQASLTAGSDLSHATTKVGAGGTAWLISGTDTTLKGATVQAPRIVADVGGDLLIESLQDKGSYNGKQNSASIAIYLKTAK